MLLCVFGESFFDCGLRGIHRIKLAGVKRDSRCGLGFQQHIFLKRRNWVIMGEEVRQRMPKYITEPYVDKAFYEGIWAEKGAFERSDAEFLRLSLQASRIMTMVEPAIERYGGLGNDTIFSSDEIN